MAYAGICSSDNIATNSDPYFHLATLDEFQTFVENTGTGGSCGTHAASSNNLPAVSVGTSSMTVPQNQPFRLEASGTDNDASDSLHYCWEQIDLNSQASLTSPAGVDAPRFRSFEPTTDKHRWFPQRTQFIGETSSSAEILPTAAGDFGLISSFLF